jgi:hypothetical protein
MKEGPSLDVVMVKLELQLQKRLRDLDLSKRYKTTK